MKSLIALCLCSEHWLPEVDDRNLLLRALSEPWARPSALARACCRFLIHYGPVQDSAARAAKAWPKLLPAEELGKSTRLAQLGGDRLLLEMLRTTPVCDVTLERFATGLRFNLLTAAQTAGDNGVAEPILGLYCAVARQCFINGYVFVQSEAETIEVQALRDKLASAIESNAAVSPLQLVAVAAYGPLHTLPFADRLPGRTWPEPVNAVVEQQVRAPLQEQSLRATIPVLTSIDDDVSKQVRAQYEENPYPQWVKAGARPVPRPINVVLREKFPLSEFEDIDNGGDIDVLVAGCGTGQQPIDTAWGIQSAQVLAIDLSLASLCYAERQTRALGLENIRYAQADIVNLTSLGRTFDLIEASGVLHHLADPFAGWGVLLSLLRPGGVMRLGFYSEIARQDIVAAREFIAARGYRATADDIRKCRQELLDGADGTRLKNATLVTDFFSLSECRDLLFHVQEHRLTLPEIASFIADNNLRFLGFEIDAQTNRSYARRFPDDTAMTNLANWHQYEIDNPYSFILMYRFGVQKRPT